MWKSLCVHAACMLATIRVICQALLAVFIGVLFQPCFLIITPDPVGPGYDWVDPSVKTIMVFLVPVAKMELMQCCILLVLSSGTDNWSFVSGRVSKRFGMWSISKVTGISFGRNNWLTLHFLIYDKNWKICLVKDCKSKQLPVLCVLFLPITLDWM